ncbi:hypothetical protein acsn021_19550 [Anaerocolumna cellulosilytica]|uniref:Uncharacterized protein n=1 Tax=Anaerocolumna cellulosilytica TaxID=433286 RepID=A0A6S6QXD4_9FIRM|nr:putative component of type VI protein secretion system [Anaerocolumna cellulosilytica]BCJ94386.1 hypothetical protein acsn021_19550 [Anaerocolumna cellulosilytica]
MHKRDLDELLNNGLTESYEYSQYDYTNDKIGSIVTYGFPDLSNIFRFTQYLTALNNISVLEKIDYINISLRSSDWFYKGYYK